MLQIHDVSEEKSDGTSDLLTRLVLVQISLAIEMPVTIDRQ